MTVVGDLTPHRSSFPAFELAFVRQAELLELQALELGIDVLELPVALELEPSPAQIRRRIKGELDALRGDRRPGLAA